MNAIINAVVNKDLAKKELLSATMMALRAPQEAMTLFWNAFYNSEFVKCDIAFDEEWAEGSYYGGGVDAELPELEIGEIGRSVAPGNNARRILFVKTRFGNVVLFERYSPGEDGELNGPIVQNTPRLVHQSEMFRGQSALVMQDLIDALGDGWCNDNVGLRLEGFLNLLAKNAARREALAAKAGE
ncbi:MAG: hypothetical protein P4L77_11155 [Sulfuriferula sp.]|nr:hypothetical protein [Sulfuriferula sp.]